MIKTFIHESQIKTFDLPRVEIEGERFYTTPSGLNVPSVTTILSRHSSKALDRWEQRIGLDAANIIRSIAKRRGTIIHDMLETYTRNERIDTSRFLPNHVDTYVKFRKALNEHVDNILGIEQRLYDDTSLFTAGTTDLIAEFDGVLSIIDYKTSIKEKKEIYLENYFIQSACYALMCNALHETNIQQIVILIAPDTNTQCLIYKHPVSDWTKKVQKYFNKDNLIDGRCGKQS